MIPKIKRISEISLLKHTTHTSKKGVKLYAIDAAAVDVVRISLVFDAGVKHQSKPYLASTCANMLSEGCGDFSSHQIAEMLDFYGIYYDVSVDRDFSIITICALEKFLNKALNILSEILLRPQFPSHEFEVYTSKRKMAIKVEREKIDTKAREGFVTTIFGENSPYGTFFSEDNYDNISINDLKDFYTQYFNHDNVFVVISGKISDNCINSTLEMVDSMQGGMAASKIEIPAAPKAKRLDIEVKDAVQSAIRIGRVLFDRSHSDFITMQVVSTILGGYFSSRLMTNLREDKGYTYGVSSGVANLQNSGYFAISTEVDGDATEEAIDEIFKEIEILRTEEVSEDELEMVKRVMMGEVLRILDGPFGIADVTIENIQNGTDNRATEEMIAKINAITPAEIMRVASKYLTKEKLSVVVARNVSSSKIISEDE